MKKVIWFVLGAVCGQVYILFIGLIIGILTAGPVSGAVWGPIPSMQGPLFEHLELTQNIFGILDIFVIIFLVKKIRRVDVVNKPWQKPFLQGVMTLILLFAIFWLSGFLLS